MSEELVPHVGAFTAVEDTVASWERGAGKAVQLLHACEVCF